MAESGRCEHLVMIGKKRDYVLPCAARHGYTVQQKGFGWWVHEQITAYDAPRSCSYRVVGGFPPAHQDGTLTCTPSGNGTHVDWVSGYKIPARGGGKVLEVLTAPLMRSLVFRKILAGCAKALEV